MYAHVFLFVSLLTFGLLACGTDPNSPKGFSLPKGDIIKGQTVFIKYQCLACHTLEGFENESIIKEFDHPVALGGSTSMVKTYAQLVTSIIHPSHKLAARSIHLEKVKTEDGSSKMPILNDQMTVSELIDIVTFLQHKYKVEPTQYTLYDHYHIP